MKFRRRQHYSYKGGRQKKWLTALCALILAGALAFTACLTLVIWGGRSQVEEGADLMLVLGCRVMPWGPSILLDDRLDTAFAYWQGHPDMTIVVSGGQGANEPMSEAQAMHDDLVARGVPSEQIILEEVSANTFENLTFSLALLEELGYDTTQEFVVVSNGFHLTRVRMLWERVAGTDENLSTLAAPSSHVPSRLKMYVREPLALVKSFAFDR